MSAVEVSPVDLDLKQLIHTRRTSDMPKRAHRTYTDKFKAQVV
ncbi:hypothetical protein L479_01363 [Exiguobacterium sp. S17]|nr:hypothetical protein L479_01363 [Exiguobacterium sp. S17]